MAEENNGTEQCLQPQGQDQTRAQSGRSGPRSRTGCAVCSSVGSDATRGSTVQSLHTAAVGLFISKSAEKEADFRKCWWDDELSTQRDNIQGPANPSQVFNSQQACIAGSWTSDLAAFPFLDDGLYGTECPDFGTFDAPNAENSFGTFMFADTPWHSPSRRDKRCQRPRGSNGEASFLGA